MKDRALLQHVLAEVERSEGALAVEMWFKDLELVDADREEVVLAVPSQFAKTRIEGKLAAALARAFERLLGARPVIRVKVDPSLASDAEGKPAVEAPHAPKPGAGEAPVPPPRPVRPKAALNEDMRLECFVVGVKNHLAFEASERVCESPGDRYNPLVITGGDGLGKTHLLTGIARRLRERGPDTNVLFVTGEEFANQFVHGIRSSQTEGFRHRFRRADAVIIDDIHVLATKPKTQTEFLHTFEELLNAQKQIVVSSEESPKRLEKLHPGLTGRLLAGLVVSIESPDLDTRRRLVDTLSRRHHVNLSREVADFMTRNVTRSVGDLVGAIQRLQVRASVGEKIDVALAKQSLGDLVGPKVVVAPADLIVEIVAERCAVPAQDLRGGSSRRVIAGARQVAMFLMREVTKLSLTEIGRYFQREPSTVTHAQRKIGQQIVGDDDLNRLVEDCRQQFVDRR